MLYLTYLGHSVTTISSTLIYLHTRARRGQKTDMEIWGNYLPFVGIRIHPVDNAGDPTDSPNAHWEREVFVVEWLGFGVCLWQGPILPTDL